MIVDDLAYTVDKNFQRVKNLLTLYQNLTNLKPGRKTTHTSDILRVTVVLLHATLEDLLRTLLKLKLPESEAKELNKIPLYNPNEFNRGQKFQLGELSKYRELKVNEVIEMSVHKYLDRQSFNNAVEISGAIKSIGLEITTEIKSLFPELDKMIERRHNIVHQADREKKEGQGFHKVKSISLSLVNKWLNTVDRFVIQIAKQL